MSTYITIYVTQKISSRQQGHLHIHQTKESSGKNILAFLMHNLHQKLLLVHFVGKSRFFSRILTRFALEHWFYCLCTSEKVLDIHLAFPQSMRRWCNTDKLNEQIIKVKLITDGSSSNVANYPKKN